MKAVMISIRPRYTSLIGSGRKTLEIRKKRPNLAPPFKCYIYETHGKADFPWISEDGYHIFRGRGKVIGEFICDHIIPIHVGIDGLIPTMVDGIELLHSMLTPQEIVSYIGNGQTGYGWHISELKIYDKPKELSEFFVWKKCNSCRRSGYESTACGYDEDCKVPAMIVRPPQSWCYVEELEETA